MELETKIQNTCAVVAGARFAYVEVFLGKRRSYNVTTHDEEIWNGS